MKGKFVIPVLASILIIGYIPLSDSVSITEITKLVSSGIEGDEFAHDIAMSGDTIVIGSHGDEDFGFRAGAVYVFERDFGGPDNWGQVAKLFASDITDRDVFGWSVDIDGDTIVVGAPHNQFSGDRGLVYIFERNVGGPNNWGETKRIETPGNGFDFFGNSVAISGDSIIVGDLNVAFVFDRNEGGANNWGQAGNRIERPIFGFSSHLAFVDIDGDTIFFGTPQDSEIGGIGSRAGAVYVHERNEGGVNNWGQVVKITGSDTGRFDNFGQSISISNDILAVGAPGARETNFDINSGSAYLFGKNVGGANNWGEITKLKASDFERDDQFGTSISISDDIVAVGSRLDHEAALQGGSAYIFERNLGGPDNWGQRVIKLTASDAEDSDRLGSSIANIGTTTVAGAIQNVPGSPVGANTGAAYVFPEIPDLDNDGIIDEIEFSLTGDQIGLDVFPCGDVESTRVTLDSSTGEILIEGIIDEPIFGRSNLVTIVSFTLPSGSTVPTGTLSVCLETIDNPFDQKSVVKLLGADATTTSGKSATFLLNSLLTNNLCIVDNADDVTMISQQGTAGCVTDTSISQVLLTCPSSPGLNTVTLSGFPEAPNTRTYTCQKVIEGDSTFAEVTGLSFSTLTEFADIDDDGFNNPNDDCPLLPGIAELQGCLPFGVVSFVNPSEKHGSIERTDDGTNDKYQFRIPQDLTDPNDIPSVGDIVSFTPLNDNARLSMNIVEFPVNTPPSVGSAVISPDPAFRGQTLTCNPIDVFDLDGHEVAFTFEWLNNGFAGEFVILEGQNSSTLDTNIQAPGTGFGLFGDVICRVTSFDGVDFGNTVESAPVTLQVGGGAI